MRDDYGRHTVRSGLAGNTRMPNSQLTYFLLIVFIIIGS